jgi:hypothetical protein
MVSNHRPCANLTNLCQLHCTGRVHETFIHSHFLTVTQLQTGNRPIEMFEVRLCSCDNLATRLKRLSTSDWAHAHADV